MCPVHRLVGVVCLFGIVVLGASTAGAEPPTEKEKKELIEKAKEHRRKAIQALLVDFDYKKSAEILTKAYELERRAFGDKHPSLPDTLDQIADFYREVHDSKNEVATRTKAVELLAGAFGAKHRSTKNAQWELDFAKQSAKLPLEQRKALFRLYMQTERARKQYEKGQREKAAEAFRDSIAKRKKIVGDDNPESAFELYMLGAYLRTSGKPRESLEPLRRALAIYERRFGNDESTTVRSRWGIGLAYQSLDDVELAEKHMVPALNAARRLDKDGAFSKTTLFYMTQNLAMFYVNEQRLNDAFPLAKEALARSIGVFGKKHQHYFLCLRQLALVHRIRYELRQSEKVIGEALTLAETLVGKKHFEYARTLREKGSLLWQFGAYKEAEATLEEASDLLEKTVGKEHWEYLGTRNTLGLVFIDSGFPRKAKPIYDHFVSVHTKRGNQISVAAGHHNIGYMYRMQGDFVLAERAYTKALALKRKLRGEDHIDCAITLEALGQVYGACGDLPQAEKHFREAERIREKVAGKNVVLMLPIWQELGEYYRLVHDYARAERYLKQTVELRAKYQGKRHPAYANSLDNYAKFFEDIGDLDKAIVLMKESVEIRKAVLTKRHPEYSTGLNNLASLLLAQRKYLEAERHFQEAADLAKTSKGEDHPDRLKGLANVAWCKRALGQPDEAERILKAVLAGFATFRKRSVTKLPVVGESGCLLQLAEIVSGRGDHKAALALADRALELDELLFGKDNEESASSLMKRAVLLARMGKIEESLRECERVVAVQHQVLENVFSFATEKSMEKHLANIDTSFSQFLSVAVRLEKLTPEQRSVVYSWLLRRKGVILETQCRYREASALLAHDREVANWTRELRGLRKQLIDAATHPASVTKEMIADRRERAATIESKLNRKLSSHLNTEGKVERVLEAEALAKRLPEGAVLVEFVRFRFEDIRKRKKFGLKGPEHYLAFVLRLGKKLEMVDLGPADEIDEAVAELRDNLAKTENALASASEKFVEDLYRKVAERTYRTLLGPLEEHLEGASRLVLVPDGSLHRVPFAALVHPEDKKYLIERLPIVYLSSGRDLLRPQRPLGKGVVVFAGPDFDLSVKKRADLAEKLPKSPSGLVLRGPVLRDGVKAWKSLAGAEAEADDIQKATESGKLGRVTIYKGVDAVEERLADLRSPRVLHFATHGFYYQHVQRGGPNREDIGLRTRLRGESEALFRSGIVLAGANVKLEGDDKRVEDGWLTAAEAALLDLSGTELVVLSACEAGLGDIKGSEGVYGLRRALFYAGARSIVTTLFSVPDAETRLLMQGFYGELAKGTPKGEALHKAQVELIRGRRAKTKAAHPLFWAGFVLIGEVNR